MFLLFRCYLFAVFNIIRTEGRLYEAYVVKLISFMLFDAYT